MKLMTKELEVRFKSVGLQDGVKDPIVIAKYFNPTAGGDWFCTEFDPVDRIFFGFANLGDLDCAEWGSVSLDELESFKGRFGLGIERDLHWTEKPFSECDPRTH